jgi:thioredoxin-like negative regulator of GroEL
MSKETDCQDASKKDEAFVIVPEKLDEEEVEDEGFVLAPVAGEKPPSSSVANNEKNISAKGQKNDEDDDDFEKIGAEDEDQEQDKVPGPQLARDEHPEPSFGRTSLLLIFATSMVFSVLLFNIFESIFLSINKRNSGYVGYEVETFLKDYNLKMDELLKDLDLEDSEEEDSTDGVLIMSKTQLLDNLQDSWTAEAPKAKPTPIPSIPGSMPQSRDFNVREDDDSLMVPKSQLLDILAESWTADAPKAKPIPIPSIAVVVPTPPSRGEQAPMVPRLQNRLDQQVSIKTSVAVTDYTGEISVEHLLQYSQNKMLEKKPDLPSRERELLKQPIPTLLNPRKDFVSMEGGQQQKKKEAVKDIAISLQATTLTNETFYDYVGGTRDSPTVTPAVFVLFATPYCNWSQALMPVWEDLASQVARTLDPRKKKLTIATVNCMKNTELCREQGITKLPTMRWFQNGKANDFSWGRTFAQIFRYTKEKLETLSKKKAPRKQAPPKVRTSSPSLPMVSQEVTGSPPSAGTNRVGGSKPEGRPRGTRHSAEETAIAPRSLAMGLQQVASKSSSVMRSLARGLQRMTSKPESHNGTGGHDWGVILAGRREIAVTEHLFDEHSASPERNRNATESSSLIRLRRYHRRDSHSKAVIVSNAEVGRVVVTAKAVVDHVQQQPVIPSLTPETFDEFLQTHDKAFVTFYRPCSTYSRTFVPLWKDVAARVPEVAGNKVHLATVDCSAHVELCSKQVPKISPYPTLYPTLRWFEHARAILPDYAMELTDAKILEYLYIRIKPMSLGEFNDEVLSLTAANILEYIRIKSMSSGEFNDEMLSFIPAKPPASENNKETVTDRRGRRHSQCPPTAFVKKKRGARAHHSSGGEAMESIHLVPAPVE